MESQRENESSAVKRREEKSRKKPLSTTKYASWKDFDDHLSSSNGGTGSSTIASSSSSVFHKVVTEEKEVDLHEDGIANLSYPVYLCPRLRTTCESSVGGNSCRLQQQQLFFRGLTKEMARLAEKRKDIQQNGVVEDIVDPELYPRIIPKSERVDKTQPFVDDPSLALAVRKNKVMDPPVYDKATTERVILFDETMMRSTYSWIPTLVGWNPKTKECKFRGPIQNLPRSSENLKLYRYLEQALAEFMPTFTNADCKAEPVPSDKLVCESDNYGDDWSHFNVCVKLQRYHLPPQSEYKGQWHTEGVNEQVSAVGVVYTDWPGCLIGGALKFRPARSLADKSSDWFGEIPPCSLRIEATEGSAVAFHNSIPHRFTGIYNSSRIEKKTRSFVNFFVVDPRLKNTNQIPTNADIYLVLVKTLNYDLVSEVLGWLHLTPRTHKEALELRSKAKAEMVSTKGKWGDLTYGNCGQLSFFPCGAPSAREEKIHEKWVGEMNSSEDEDCLDESPSFYHYVKHKKPVDEVKDVLFMKYGVSDFWMFRDIMDTGTYSTSSGETIPE